jgi:methyl-accepting chemotaxis protein
LAAINTAKSAIDEISEIVNTQFEAVSEAIESNPEFVENIEAANKSITEISSMYDYDKAVEQRNAMQKV